MREVGVAELEEFLLYTWVNSGRDWLVERVQGCDVFPMLFLVLVVSISRSLMNLKE